MTMPLQLKMPHPGTWLRWVLEQELYETEAQAYDDVALEAIVGVAVPVISAATLEAAAELVESYGENAPGLTGGQWLRALAEQFRDRTVSIGGGPAVTLSPAPASPRAQLEVERERDNLAREVRRLEALVKDRKRAPWWRRMGGSR